MIIGRNGPAAPVAGGVITSTGINVMPQYEEFDPNVDLGSWNFHLARWAVLVDEGVEVVGEPLDHDMDGEYRPSNAAPDIGPDEIVDCLAQVVSTGNIYGRIGLALDEAGDGGEVRVAEGTCNESLNIDKDITITGGWNKQFSGLAGQGVSNLVVPDDLQERAITVQKDISATLEFLYLNRGYVIGNGGGVYIDSNSVVNLKEMSINDCYASGNGGGIYSANNSEVLIWDTSIYGSTAGGSGGGIYSAAGSTVEISGGATTRCEAGEDGGGIYSPSEADVTLTNHFISANEADNGGGHYNAVSNAEIVNVKYWANIARQAGGGLYNAGDNVALYHQTFYQNQVLGASSTGGGIQNTGSGVVISASIIAENAASVGDGL